MGVKASHYHQCILLFNFEDLLFQGRKVAGSEFHFGDNQRRRVHLYLQQLGGHPRPGCDLPGRTEEQVQVCGRAAGQPKPE